MSRNLKDTKNSGSTRLQPGEDVTETGDGNPGLINGAVVNGICKAIAAKTRVMNAPEEFFKVMDGLSLSDLVENAREESLRTGNPVQFILTREINASLRDAGLAR
jgi:hypothetical protein